MEELLVLVVHLLRMFWLTRFCLLRRVHLQVVRKRLVIRTRWRKEASRQNLTRTSRTGLMLI